MCLATIVSRSQDRLAAMSVRAGRKPREQQPREPRPRRTASAHTARLTPDELQEFTEVALKGYTTKSASVIRQRTKVEPPKIQQQPAAALPVIEPVERPLPVIEHAYGDCSDHLASATFVGLGGRNGERDYCGTQRQIECRSMRLKRAKARKAWGRQVAGGIKTPRFASQELFPEFNPPRQKSERELALKAEFGRPTRPLTKKPEWMPKTWSEYFRSAEPDFVPYEVLKQKLLKDFREPVAQKCHPTPAKEQRKPRRFAGPNMTWQEQLMILQGTLQA